MLRRALMGLILIAIAIAACDGPRASTPTRRPLPTFTPTITLPTPTPLPAGTPAWFREAVVYHILPRSFYDGDGDGVGDLNGITQKLDYLDELGVSALRLGPVFAAASAGGYDTIDYLTIAPDLGTQQDLITLVHEAHGRNIRVILDFVAGYTSDQNPFFQDAHGNKDSSYAEWYLWKNTAHTSYQAFGDNRTLPLLDLDNAVVQRYMLEIARYWMDLDNNGDLTDGLDGFCFPDAQVVSPNFWKMLRTDLKTARPNFLLMGEVWEQEADKLAPYYAEQFDAMLDFPTYYTLTGGPDRRGDGLINGQGTPASLLAQIQRELDVLPPTAQVVRFANNPDTNRIASEMLGNLALQKQAAAILLTLPGTPMIYYGEEVGMQGARNAARGPMDWQAVETQNGQPDSLLYVYETTIAQRRAHACLSLGGIQSAEAQTCPTCLAYWRWDNDDFYLLLFNFDDDTQATTIDFTTVPRPVRGAGEDVLRGTTVNVPSNGRYTLTIEAASTRVLHWGKP